MFGGFAYYFENKLVLCLFEDSDTKSYKNLKYNFAIWNGCLFPSDRENHVEILKKFPFLINHPVLPKWLYLPQQSENFESHTELILKEIRRRSALFGTIPKQKKKTPEKKTPEKKTHVDSYDKIDTRRPRMFASESVDLSKAKNISDLKNLGPASELNFTKAGIKSAQQFIKMGWKKAMVKLVKSDKRNRHSLFAYALIGALNNQLWSKISEADKAEAREFVKKLKK